MVAELHCQTFKNTAWKQAQNDNDNGLACHALHQQNVTLLQMEAIANYCSNFSKYLLICKSLHRISSMKWDFFLENFQLSEIVTSLSLQNTKPFIVT